MTVVEVGEETYRALEGRNALRVGQAAEVERL